MAKHIDYMVGNGLMASAYYVLFLNAWGSVLAACVLAFIACTLTKALLKRRPLPRRVTASQARSELLRMATLEDRAAEVEMKALIGAHWPDGAYTVAPILKHPEAALTSGDILAAWKANRQASGLVIVATCPCESRAALYAQELQNPEVAVVDSRAIVRLLRRLPADRLPPAPRRKAALRWLWSQMGATRPRLRDALLALMMLAAYLISGNAWYLFSALALLALMALGIVHCRPERRLFRSGRISL